MFSKQKFSPIRNSYQCYKLTSLSLSPDLFITYQTDRGIWWLVVPWVWGIRKLCSVSFSVWPWGSWLPFIFPSSVVASEKEQHYPELLLAIINYENISLHVCSESDQLHRIPAPFLTFPSQDYPARQVSCPLSSSSSSRLPCSRAQL